MRKVIATYLVDFDGKITEVKELRNGLFYRVRYLPDGSIRYIEMKKDDFDELNAK